MYFRRIDEWTARVEQETTRLKYLFERQPGSYQHSEAYYRMMVLVTVLQRDLGVHCSPRFNTMSDAEFFSRPAHLFMHGVLDTREGTCSSLPPTFAAVGRRLGYPLKLVTACQHVFLRWDGATGERFNIECTSTGLVSHPDDHYRQWPRSLTDEQIRRTCSLQSLTPRQELALFVGNRGHVLLEHDDLWKAAHAYAYAADIFPESSACAASLVGAMNRWDRKLHALLMLGFPSMQIFFPPRGFPNVPLDLECGICHMMAKEKLLLDESLQKEWWEPLRRNPSNPPRPARTHRCAFPAKTGRHAGFSLCKEEARRVSSTKSSPCIGDHDV